MTQLAIQFDAPLCRQRGLLMETPGGERVSLSALHISMTPHETYRWFTSAMDYHRPDEFGYLPADFELFLESLGAR